MSGAWLTPVVIAMVRVSPTVTIDSDSRCPSAEMVAGALAALGAPSRTPELSVMIRSSGERLALEFSWRGKPDPEVRELAAGGDCAARAQSAAVSLAAWVGLFPAVAVPPPSFPTRDPAPASGAPAPAAAPPPVAARASGAGRAPVPRATWLGAGLHAAASAGVVPGVSIAVEQMRRGAGLRLGWRSAGFVSMPQHESLGGATSSWIRPALLAGLVVGRSVGAVDAVATVGAVGGLAVAWGSGYAMDKRAGAVDGGAAAALRIGGAGTGRINPWLELTAVGWIGTQRLRVDAAPGGTPASVDLPRWEGMVAIGWSIELS